MVAGAAKKKAATPSTTAQPPLKKTIAPSRASCTTASVFRLPHENNDEDDDNKETILVDSAGDEDDEAPGQYHEKKKAPTTKPSHQQQATNTIPKVLQMSNEEDNDDDNFDAPTQYTPKKGAATSKLAKSISQNQPFAEVGPFSAPQPAPPAMTAGGTIVGGDVSRESVEDFPLSKTPSKLTLGPVKRTPRTLKTLPPIYKRPGPQDLVIALNDCTGAQYLTAAVDTCDYFWRAQFYHARLLLIITGLNYNQLVQLKQKRSKFQKPAKLESADHYFHYLDKESAIMNENLALAACLTITLEGIGLYHWFASDSSQLYYQALFRALGSIAMRTAHAIVYNPNDNVQTDEIRQILRAVPVFLLLLPIYAAKLVPPFFVTNLTLAEVLKSTPHWDPEVYSKATAPRNPEYIRAIESHKIKVTIDQSIKIMGLATDKEWFADVGKYEEEIAVCQSSYPPMFLDAGNAMSLEPPVLAAKETDDFMEQLWFAKWPRFAAFMDARYNAEIQQIDVAILFLYKQISKAKAAKERIIVNKEERKKLVAFMLASQKSLEAKQQALEKATGAAEKNQQKKPSLLTSLRQNPSH
ncbi:hypothetical protein MMC31_007594 [Peltigera leucophlebia]|nr:hypothetical protein [Peltigera leucophlebia]